MQLRVFVGPIYFKDNLRTFEAQFPKKLRTTEAHFEFTGPYKKNKAQRPTMRPHAFFGISYHRDARDEIRGGNLSTAIVTIGGRYARELF